MPLTRGFRARWLLNQHFDDHTQDFGAANEWAYEALADAFLGGPLGATVIECFRTQFDGARVRYDYVSQEFGILDVNRYILTYFKPDPAEHGHSTNRAYFDWQKRRKK